MTVRTETITYVAKSVRGNPIASFDNMELARKFVYKRHSIGIPVKLARVTTVVEEIA